MTPCNSRPSLPSRASRRSKSARRPRPCVSGFQLGDYSSADLSVHYREPGSTVWLSSPEQTKDASGSVDVELEALLPGTSYEYRAVVSYADGSDRGDISVFTTPALQITVTPVSGQSKAYGQLDPALAYVCVPIILDPDPFSGRLARAVGEDVGTYAITKGSLQLPARYELKFAEGVTFAITPASTGTTVNVDGTSIYYGGSVTLTAEVTPANVGSPLTGTVDFAVNGTPYGTSAVSPVAGSPTAPCRPPSPSRSTRRANYRPPEARTSRSSRASPAPTPTTRGASVLRARCESCRRWPPRARGRSRSTPTSSWAPSWGSNTRPVHDQLQLSSKTTAFPYVWIPNFDGTISKVNTETGAELGRYKTGPGQLGPIAHDGRPRGQLLHRQSQIGKRGQGRLARERQLGSIATTTVSAIPLRDTNGDGYISGAEILPWGQDEAVLYELVLVAGHEGAYVPGTFAGPYDTNYYGHRAARVRGRPGQRRLGRIVRTPDVLPHRWCHRRDHADAGSLQPVAQALRRRPRQ